MSRQTHTSRLLRLARTIEYVRLRHGEIVTRNWNWEMGDGNVQLRWELKEIQFRALADGLQGVRCARESNYPALLTLGKAKLFSDRE